ncbi:uncharacterized protein LOC132560057 [Ylistrum balloti]|uniref:uncharacterized protein LOC132560057 n=1 Tax=Ylistrum balloti TaxID=509963 RepID=UPI002905DC01|nr:uncharacterized protein LOC132560057 [Ylistrum balloti]
MVSLRLATVGHSLELVVGAFLDINIVSEDNDTSAPNRPIPAPRSSLTRRTTVPSSHRNEDDDEDDDSAILVSYPTDGIIADDEIAEMDGPGDIEEVSDDDIEVGDAPEMSELQFYEPEVERSEQEVVEAEQEVIGPREPQPEVQEERNDDERERQQPQMEKRNDRPT